MERGWVKFFRKIDQWEWYKDGPTKDLFIHLLIKANREPKKYRGIDIPAGAVLTSIRRLSDETGLSERQIRTAINHLKSTHEVTQVKSTKYTLLIVESFTDYQSGDTQNDTQPTQHRHTSDTAPTHERHTIDTEVTTNKKDKKEEKDKKDKKERRKEYTGKAGPADPSSPSAPSSASADVIQYLNKKAGKKFSPTAQAIVKPVIDRLNEGYTKVDLKAVIDYKTGQWKDDEKMDRYLRPSTLFGEEKFARYLEEAQGDSGKGMSEEEWNRLFGGVYV